MAHETKPERAHAFTAGACADPTCGLHLIARDRDDKPICELVIGRAQLRGLLAYIHGQGLDLP